MDGPTRAHLVKYLPNTLTTLRLLLTIPICVFILRAQYGVVLGLIFFAGFSDLIDGWLARRLNALSRYGAVVDPMSDKALLIGSYICLAIVGLIPQWVALVVVARDLVIVSGALAYHWLIGRYDMSPSLWGKLCTLVQVGFVLMVVIQQVAPVFPAAAFRAGLWLLLAVTLISGGNYVSVWGKRALEKFQHEHE